MNIKYSPRQWHFISLTAIISIVSLYLSIWGRPGSVTLYMPAGYGIVRGSLTDYLIKKYSGPSEHLILQLEWCNTKWRSVDIRNCELLLTEVAGDGKEKENGEHYRFLMAGDYPSINDESLRKDYSISNSLILPPNSCTRNILIFHNDNWWNEKSNLYNHQFELGKKYFVKIKFDEDNEEVTQKLFIMPILKWGPGSGRNWEFWYRGQDW